MANDNDSGFLLFFFLGLLGMLAWGLGAFGMDKKKKAIDDYIDNKRSPSGKSSKVGNEEPVENIGRGDVQPILADTNAASQSKTSPINSLSAEDVAKFQKLKKTLAIINIMPNLKPIKSMNPSVFKVPESIKNIKPVINNNTSAANTSETTLPEADKGEKPTEMTERDKHYYNTLTDPEKEEYAALKTSEARRKWEDERVIRQMEERMNALDEVVITAKIERKVELESGRSEQEVNADGQQKMNEHFEKDKDITDKEALKIAERTIGKDDVAYKISHADVATIISPAVHKYGLSAVIPISYMAQVTDTNILQDKYKDKGEGEIQLKPSGGKFNVGESFILAYFNQNQLLPLDDKRNEMQSAKYVEGGTSKFLEIQVTKDAVKKYLPEATAEEIKLLTETPVKVSYSDSFSLEVYNAWKEFVNSDPAFKEKQKVEIADRTVSIVPTQKMLDGFNGSLDREFINKQLGDWENVTIKQYEQNLISQTVEANNAYVNTDKLKAKEKTKDANPEEYEKQKQRFEETKKEQAEELKKIEDRIELLGKLKEEYKGKNEREIKFVIDDLIRLEKIKLKEQELFEAIYQDKDRKALDSLAEEYLTYKQRTETIIYAQNIDKKDKAFTEAADLGFIPSLTPEEKKIVDDVLKDNEKYFVKPDEDVPDLQAIMKAMDSGALQESKDDSYRGAIKVSGAGFKTHDEKTGKMAILEGKFKSFTEKDKFTFNTNINLSASVIKPDEGSDNFLKPLEVNPYDYSSRQNIELGAKYKYHPYKILHADIALKSSPAEESKEFGISNEFKSLKGNGYTVGVILPSVYEYGSDKVKASLGAKLRYDGKVYMTGDELNYFVDIGASRAQYQPAYSSVQYDNSLLAYASTGFSYIYNATEFRGGAKLQLLNPANDNKEGFYNLSTSFSGTKKLSDNFILSLNNNNFLSEDFKLTNIGLEAGISGKSVENRFSAGLTSLRINIPNLADEQLYNILSAGYKIGFKKGFLKDFEVGTELNFTNENLNYIPARINIVKNFSSKQSN